MIITGEPLTSTLKPSPSDSHVVAGRAMAGESLGETEEHPRWSDGSSALTLHFVGAHMIIPRRTPKAVGESGSVAFETCEGDDEGLSQIFLTCGQL